MLVPALTLPVRGATALVATMPVPASPSGGQNGMPARSAPVGSSSAAPSAVSSPAAAPGDEHVGQQRVERAGQAVADEVVVARCSSPAS